MKRKVPESLRVMGRAKQELCTLFWFPLGTEAQALPGASPIGLGAVALPLSLPTVCGCQETGAEWEERPRRTYSVAEAATCLRRELLWITAAVKARPHMGAQGCRRSLEVGQGGLSTIAATPKQETCSSLRRR